MKLAHTTHLGEDIIWSNVKKIWHWPSLKNDPKTMCDQCEACQEEKRLKNKSNPVLSMDLLFLRPGAYLLSDLVELDEKTYITVTDRLSGLILSEKLKNKSASVRALREFIYKLGVPITLRKDCGKNYTSREFNTFCKQSGINHRKSSPHYHQRNGASEKSIDVLK